MKGTVPHNISDNTPATGKCVLTFVFTFLNLVSNIGVLLICQFPLLEEIENKAKQRKEGKIVKHSMKRDAPQPCSLACKQQQKLV